MCKYVPCPRNKAVQIPVHKRGWHEGGTYNEQTKDHLRDICFSAKAASHIGEICVCPSKQLRLIRQPKEIRSKQEIFPN